MQLRDADQALVAAGETVPDWSGGTRLGEGLKVFLDRWGQRGLVRGAVVVVFSDGWERGDAALLGEQMPGCTAGAPRGLGQPAQGRRRLPAGAAGDGGGAPARSTTSSPATRWRRSRRCWRWSPVREVLDQLLAWWRAGETVGMGTVVATFRSAPRPPGASMLVGPGRLGRRLGLRRLRRGRGLRARPEGGRRGRAAAAPLRRQRRRRLRGRPDLRRHPRRVRRAGRPGRPSPSSEASPTTSADDRPVAVATVVDHPDPSVGRRMFAAPARRPVAGTLGSARLDDDAVARRRARPARAGPQRRAQLRTRRRAARRGHAGLRLGLRARAADDRLRRDRLRRRGRADRRLPRLPRHRLRRPARVRHRHPLPVAPTRSSSPGRTSTSRPRPTPAGSTAARVLCVLTHDPKFDVPAARGGAGAPRRRLRRGDGVAEDPRRPAGAAPRGRGRRGGAGAALLADRPRPRRAHPGGDRGQHRRRDHRAAVGRRRASGWATRRAASTTSCIGRARLRTARATGSQARSRLEGLPPRCRRPQPGRNVPCPTAWVRCLIEGRHNSTHRRRVA